MSIGCKFAVPVFFMISGALLLGKEESIAIVFKKRILRCTLILLAISGLYWGYDVFVCGLEMGLSAFIERVYSSEMATALWYMYSYLAMLLMLPLLRRLAQAMRGADYLYLAGMSLLLTGIVPVAEALIGGEGAYHLNGNLNGALFVSVNIVYVLMGYYIEHVMPEEAFNRKMIFGAMILSAASIFFSAWLTLCRIKQFSWVAEGDAQTFHNCFVAVLSYTVYLGSKMLFEQVRIPACVSRMIVAMGETIFGFFLLERVFREQTKFIFDLLKPYIKTMPASLVWITCALALGMSVVYLLRKIPGIKKLL